MNKPNFEEYVKQGGVKCPSCKADDIEGGFVEINQGTAWQSISCGGCGAHWVDVYSLESVVEFERGE